jgi:hypothetical protein
MTDTRITWDRGQAEIQRLGGMVGPLTLVLEDGRAVSPLAVAPWGDDQGADYAALPPLLQRLRGEWPCVPFGAPEPPEGLPQAWRPAAKVAAGADFHGFSSHNPWQIAAQDEGAVTLAIDYPEDHPVARLERRIAGVPGQAALDLSLTIHARRAAAVPLALHPVFRLPQTPGAARLDPGPFAEGRSFPLPVEPGVSRLTPDARFQTLVQVPAGQGTLALDRLPLEGRTEELVQLCGTTGRVTLANDEEGYAATLDYDAAVFPSTMLWLSNRGRSAYPWKNRFLGLGIEPVRAAFDLGPDVGADPANPIARAGFPTALEIAPGRPFTTRYRISATGL